MKTSLVSSDYPTLVKATISQSLELIEITLQSIVEMINNPSPSLSPVESPSSSFDPEPSEAPSLEPEASEAALSETKTTEN